MSSNNSIGIAGYLLVAGASLILSACGDDEESMGSSSTSSSSGAPFSFTPPDDVKPVDPVLLMAINAGGGNVSLDGIQYQADEYFTGGETYDTADDISGTNEDTLFQTERYGSSAYAFPVPAGTYTVYLHFAEIFSTATGERSFNVDVEGQSALAGLDIFQLVGHDSAYTKELANIAVDDGMLNIEFEDVVGNAKVSAIAIYQAGVVVTHASIGKEIFDKQCKGCHAATTKAVGTQLDESGHSLPSLRRATEAMPPAGAEASFGACDAECAYYTAKYIASVNPFFGRPIPGPEPDAPMDAVDSVPPVMARLSRSEYNNTIRDLFGITSNPADDFPADISGTFNNDNAALSISNRNVEMYNSAAIAIATEVVSKAFNGDRTVITCDGTNATCAQTVISDLGLKIWRRPLSGEETSMLKSLYDDVQSTTNNRRTSMAALVRVMLLSPNFIYRPEFDQSLSSSQAKALSAYELASRLSYFLWGSTPDDRLLAKAADGSLTNDSTLRAEVTRLLADERSEILLENFAWIWLGFEDYEGHEVDETQFPQYTDAVKEALVSETKAFLSHILKEGRPISEILDANYTFLNETSAKFYGVPGISGNNMRRYDWPDGSPRMGLMGHGSALTAHSHPDKTSPVKRGAWVMHKFMCDRPAEPPEDVIAQFPTLPDGLNPRAESELHKESSPVCKSCHAYVDPIGYGMENFSPVGQWRDEYPNGDTVDPSSVLPTGESFSSLTELAKTLAPKGQVMLCSISYAMTYATGRRLNTLYESGQPSDYAAVYNVYKNTKDSAHSISDVFTEIVLSPAFRMRRGADSQ